MRLRGAVLFAIVIAAGASPHGQTRSAVASADDRAPYILATTFLQTLSLTASARDSLAEISQSSGNPISDSVNAIVIQRGAVSRMKQAIGLLDQFRDSRDESLRQAAADLTTIYQALADRLLSGVVIWEKFAKTKTVGDVAGLVPELGKHGADIQEAWRLLPVGVGSVTHTLVDHERLTDGKRSYLRLTRAERARLNGEITAMFPNVKPETRGGQIVDASVNLFRQFLNQPWKSADER